MAVELVPIGRIPLSVNSQDLAGCERVDIDETEPKTFHAGPGFTDYTTGRKQFRATLVFALFSQKQEFEEAIANVPTVNGARRFNMTYQEGTVKYLVRKAQKESKRASGDEIAGNASLTVGVVGAEVVPLTV